MKRFVLAASLLGFAVVTCNAATAAEEKLPLVGFGPKKTVEYLEFPVVHPVILARKVTFPFRHPLVFTKNAGIALQPYQPAINAAAGAAQMASPFVYGFGGRH